MMREHSAKSIHKEMIVFDAHCDTVERILSKGIDLGVRSSSGHVDIPRLVEGGVNAQVFACCIIRSDKPDGYYLKLALRMIDALHLQFAKHSDKIELALTAKDVRRIKQNGRIAAILAIEGGEAIEDDLALLRTYHRLGVRLMTLTWNSTNWADASREELKHNGLTDFGKDVVKEMNRLGVIIDVSHAADKTVWDTLEISSDPIVASHSCARALCDHPRNVSDNLIKAISEKGGVICVNFYSVFLDQLFKDQSERGLKPRLLPLSKVVDHIDHIAEVGGIDSVGLGSDFDGIGALPKGIKDVSSFPNIIYGLLERGYSETDIEKICSGNILRVWKKIEESAIGGN